MHLKCVSINLNSVVPIVTYPLSFGWAATWSDFGRLWFECKNVTVPRAHRKKCFSKEIPYEIYLCGVDLCR